MFRFAEENYLYALYLIPILGLLYWFTFKKEQKLLKLFADEKLHSVLFPLRSKFKQFVKFVLILISLALIIVGLSNPQLGSKIEEVKQVGIDVFIVLDVSLSMKAEDIKPNRLEKAKHEIAKLIQKLRGDRIGLIVFSGQAYIQFPLTTDYSAANLFLSAVDFKTVPQAGTAIASALELATNSFKGEEETKKAIIVITDGEDHEGDWTKAAEEAVDKGVQIYSIGLGSPSGVPIPVYDASGISRGYKKDNQNKVVLTKLDESTLQRIAELGNGKYFRGSNNDDDLNKIYDELAKIEKSEFGATKITDYEDRFYYFLFPALLFLIIEFFISGNKSKYFAKIFDQK